MACSTIILLTHIGLFQLNLRVILTPQRPFALELGDNQDLALMKPLSQLSLPLLLRPASYYKIHCVCANTFHLSFPCKTLKLYIWMQHWLQNLDIDDRMWFTLVSKWQSKANKLAKLLATLVRNYYSPTDSLTGVKCRATSVAKNATTCKLIHTKHKLCLP